VGLVVGVVELLGGSGTVGVVLVVGGMLGALELVDVVGADDPDAAGGVTGAGWDTGLPRCDAAAMATGGFRRWRWRRTAPRRPAFV
jgi:hypothetical protein